MGGVAGLLQKDCYKRTDAGPKSLLCIFCETALTHACQIQERLYASPMLSAATFFIFIPLSEQKAHMSKMRRILLSTACSTPGARFHFQRCLY